MRRVSVLAVTVGLALVGGCGPAVGSPGERLRDASAAPPSGRAAPASSAGASSRPADPAAVLRSAVAGLDGLSFRFTLGGGARHAEGVYQASTGAAALVRVEDGRRREVDVFGSEVLLSGFVPGGAVLRVDADRLPGSSELLPVAAPVAAVCLPTGARKVEVADDDRYTGQIDLAEAGGCGSVATRHLVGYLARQAGDHAGDIGFTAVVGASGRLAEFRATFPEASAGRDLEYEFAVTEVDPGLTVTRPAGPVVDAPAGTYQP